MNEEWTTYLRILRGDFTMTTKGGPGSGNWAHKGRKGKRGGSAPKKGGSLPPKGAEMMAAIPKAPPEGAPRISQLEWLDTASAAVRYGGSPEYSSKTPGGYVRGEPEKRLNYFLENYNLPSWFDNVDRGAIKKKVLIPWGAKGEKAKRRLMKHLRGSPPK